MSHFISLTTDGAGRGEGWSKGSGRGESCGKGKGSVEVSLVNVPLDRSVSHQ